MQVPNVEIRKQDDLVELLQCTARFLWKCWPNMQAVYHGDRQFSLRGVCPHCSHNSVFVTSTGLCTERINPDQPSHFRLIAGMKCQGCQDYILGIVILLEDIRRCTYEAHYPLGKPNDEVAEEIPTHIQEDFKEALRCQFVDAWNATAEMCRRSIEASCIDLGIPKGIKALEDMIDSLETQRKITPHMKEVAHKIRLGGNRGAHPPENGPRPEGEPAPEYGPVETIGKDHAEAIVDYTRHFLHHVYVMPKQLDKYDFSKPKVPKV